jgi:hypothetical protein
MTVWSGGRQGKMHDACMVRYVDLVLRGRPMCLGAYRLSALAVRRNAHGFGQDLTQRYSIALRRPSHEIGERWIGKFERSRLQALSDMKKALEARDE